MHRVRLWLIAGSLAVFLLSYLSINTDVGSDPKLTLLVSQALVDHQTVYLDAYVDETLIDAPFANYVAEGVILPTGEHYSHYFPVGPSLVALPFVALARLGGWDMRTTDNYRLQELLSALTVALAFLLSYALARCYVSGSPALVIAFVSVMGSSLISTMGTAFWSLNPAVLFIGGALLLLARSDGDKARPLPPLALGGLLFLAFLCRATAAAFILPVFGYLALRQRRSLLPVAAVALALLLVYVLWTYRLTGSATTAYYSPARLGVERAPLWVGVAGNLVSPGRGIFVFSPFLLALLAGCVAYWRSLWRRPMVWLCLVWFGLHVLLVARAASWWGGWSFGPRLLTDLWPGLVVLTALWWAAVAGDDRDRHRRLWGMAYLGLAVPAILTNALVGLYSQPASRWNGLIDPVAPPGDPSGSDLFDWRHPQILATNAMLCGIVREKVDRAPEQGQLAAYRLGQTIGHNADRILVPWLVGAPAPDAAPALTPDAVPFRFYLPVVSTTGNLARFVGWSAPVGGDGRAGLRLSVCRRAEIRFYLAKLPESGAVTLALRGQSLGRQNVRYYLNGTEVGQQLWSGDLFETQTVGFAGDLLREDALNVLAFDFPDAHFASLRDQRPRGLALESVTLSPGAAGPPAPGAAADVPAPTPGTAYPAP